MRAFGQLTRVSICLGLLVLSTGCRATNGWVMNNSGMGYYQRGNYAAARNEFARAVADDPYHPDYRHNLAMAMQKQGDLAGAERVLRHNLTIDPMHQPTYHALAQSLMLQQRPAEAQELITEWVETQPYATSSYIEMAWLQRELGNTAAAEQSLRQALQVEPNNPVALAQLGQVYHDTGRTDQAAAYYQRSLATRWNQPEVQSRLATLSGGQQVRRSAMVQNPAFAQPVTFAQGPVVADQTFLAANGAAMPVTVTSMPVDDPVQHLSRREERRERRQNRQPLAAYPLPTYGTDVAMWNPTSVAISAPAVSFQQPIVAQHPIITDQTIITDAMASQPIMAAPTVASGPTLIPQADPAHATNGTTAGLPVVSPY